MKNVCFFICKILTITDYSNKQEIVPLFSNV